ncbi:MAG: alpha/beta fold hydrolase [archaeon]|nr:alpha/beta fold hydrolase [archaeon]
MEEKLFFTTSDGLKLCGILSKPGNITNKCIILCHGLSVNKDEKGRFISLTQKLIQNNFAVFRFDFRAHGESEGIQQEMTITGEEKDLESAINFLQTLDFQEFGILAASFSGGCSSLFCSKNPKNVKALVLFYPLLDYEARFDPVTERDKIYWGKPALKRIEKFGYTEVGTGKFKVGKNLIEEMRKLKPFKELQKVKIPILFVHGDKDVLIPLEKSVNYSKLVKAELVVVKGGGHGFHENKEASDKAENAAVNFFLKNL